MQNQMALLEQASRSSSAFVERKRSLNINEGIKSQVRDALEMIDMWSHDLVKLLGRFGQKLLDIPEPIVRYTPQFCPLFSRISHQFEQDSNFWVPIFGEANAIWDDTLIKIPLVAGSGAVHLRRGCSLPRFMFHLSLCFF